MDIGSDTSFSLPVIPVTGDPVFDHFFSLVFILGAVAWWFGQLAGLFRGR